MNQDRDPAPSPASPPRARSSDPPSARPTAPTPATSLPTGALRSSLRIAPHAPDPDKSWLRWAVVGVLFVGVPVGGYKLWQHAQAKKVATLSACSVLTGVHGTRSLECGLTFQRAPDSVHALRIEARGAALETPATFDWPAIVKRFRFDRVAESGAPPVGKTLRLALPAKLRARFSPGLGDYIVEVRLFDGEAEVDKELVDTRSIYKSE